MFCKNCGKEIDENAVFCPHCGGQQKVVVVEVKQQPTIINSRAVFSFIFALISIPLGWFIIPQIIAIAAGIGGRKDSKNCNARNALADWGLGIGAISLLLYGFCIVATVALILGAD